MKAFKKEIVVDREEYLRIADRYIDMVYRVALNSCKNTYDADDVVQNTFMKLLKCKKNFESDEHVRNWLIKVAVNECNSIWSSSWKKRNVALDEGYDSAYNEPVFSQEEQGELYEKLMELPPKYRQVLYLYYYEELSIREIAGVLKISETAVSTRLQRARLKIKEKLGGQQNG